MGEPHESRTERQRQAFDRAIYFAVAPSVSVALAYLPVADVVGTIALAARS